MKTKQSPVIFIFLVSLTLLLVACQTSRGLVDTGVVTDTAPAEIQAISDPTTQPAPVDTPSYPQDEDPDATATAQVAAITGAVKPRGKSTSTSPDGRWRAEVWRYECTPLTEGEMAFEELRLFDSRSGQMQVIATQLQYCGGLGGAGLEALAWSRNTRFLYFTTAAEGVPDGGCGYWQPPLTAYALETGEPVSGTMIELAQGPLAPGRSLVAGQGVMAYWHAPAHSETGEPLEQPDLVLWDLERGEVGRIAPVEAGWNRGPVVWSPDGSRLAFIETENGCFPGGETLVAIADPASGETHVLKRSAETPFAGLEWSEPGSLSLVDEAGQAWELDVP